MSEVFVTWMVPGERNRSSLATAASYGAAAATAGAAAAEVATRAHP